MPGNTPENGDVYRVYRNVTTDPAKVGKPRRPIACVAAQKADPYAWRGMARSSTDGRPQDGDLFSPHQNALGLDKDGYWSTRWLHHVLKAKTGGLACSYLGSLTQPEKSDVLALYRNRLK